MNGITISGREWVVDTKTLGKKKEVITFGVVTASLINSILTEYPETGEGSYAICIPEGVCKQLIGGVWV